MSTQPTQAQFDAVHTELRIAERRVRELEIVVGKFCDTPLLSPELESANRHLQAANAQCEALRKKKDEAMARVKELEAAVEAANFRALMAQADDSVRDALADALRRVKELEEQSAGEREARIHHTNFANGEASRFQSLLFAANADRARLKRALGAIAETHPNRGTLAGAIITARAALAKSEELP